MVNDALVVGYPDSDGAGYAMGSPILTVAYRSSRFSPPGSFTTLSQDRTVTLSVFLQAQDLQNDELILPLIEKVQAILTSYQPFGDDGNYMYPVSDSYVSDQNKDFLREMQFSISLAHTPSREYQ